MQDLTLMVLMVTLDPHGHAQALVGGSAAAGQNPPPNIGRSLANLDIATAASGDHQNHFHVYLKPPVALAINTAPHALLADSAGAESLSSVMVASDIRNQTALNNQEMLMFDYFVTPQISIEPPELVAQATSSKPKILKPFNFCRDIESGVSGSTANAFTVFRSNEWISIQQAINHNNKVRLIQAPMHGKVMLSDGITPITVGNTETGINSYMNEYVPDENYIGKDRAVFEVEANNKKYRVTVNFWVMSTVFDDGKGGDTNCKQQKFGLANDAPQSVSAWQLNADLSAFLAAASGVTYSFSDLPATALGETTGQGLSAQITLDTNAAGHNWYIDPTPLDNTDDYLPTSDPTVWKAKAGSAAAGKMDMLSVLLHEYGHALGLEHSGAASDFMAASLQPGVRKLPSAAELTLMSQLVAELKNAGGEALTLALSQGERGQVQSDAEQDPSNPGLPSPLSALGLLPLGFMRRNDGKGSANAGVAMGAAIHTDYLTAINTTLANGSFSARQNGTIDQWESVGNVSTTSVTASQVVMLGESTTAQAHLGQAFVLSAQDRFLTFTVSGLDLQTNSIEQNGVFTAAPQDAFEIALQNTSTGANLLANGTSNLGNCPF